MTADKTYVSLSYIYDAEIKALVKAACNDMGRPYMDGISSIVELIESDLISAKGKETEQPDE